MKGWRMKFIFLLIVYFAGFATAIYCLAPAPDAKAIQPDQKIFTYSNLKSDEFVKTFNVAMHKAVEVAKEASISAGTWLKEKFDERQNLTAKK
jgi:hypothetical protein